MIITAIHWYNYARVNSQLIGTHAIGNTIITWIHCRKGVHTPGNMVRFTCAYRDNKGGTGFVFTSYHYVAAMAHGMVIR